MTPEISAALLGLVEGVTEFLPVSSTGHLIIFDELLGFKGPPGHVFEIVIQLAAILAVVVFYWRKLLQVVRDLPRKDEAGQGARRLTTAVLVAFLPAAAIGAVLHGFIKERLFNVPVVCAALIVGGVILWLIERLRPHITVHHLEQVPVPTALKIGFVQCLAMIPGVSRAGATIVGGLLLGLDRRVAAEFSFFLAIPTMAGATALDLYKNWGELGGADWQLILIGCVVAFISALLVIRLFLTYVTRHGFAPFAIYRILFGAVAWYWIM